MIKRPFGRTGLQVSPLTVGGMRFLHGWDPPHDQLPDDSLDNVHQILTASLAAGINLIETARGYGKSEYLLGQTIHHFPREQWMLMTKAAPTAKAGELRKALEESLRRMRVERVELFALHGINTPEDLAISLRVCVPELQKAQQENLITAFGFSSHGHPPVIVEAIATGAFAFANLHYNLFNPRLQVAVALAGLRGMAIMIISPNEKAGHLYTPSPFLRQLTAPLHPVILNERWLLAQAPIATLSIGLSDPLQLPLHLAAVANAPPWLGEVENQALLRIHQQAVTHPLHRCDQCRACLPCPQGINIPEVLRLMHGSQALGLHDFTALRYNQTRPDNVWVAGAKGDACDDCGDCLPRCPQALAIPGLLRQAHHHLQDTRPS